MWAVFEQNGKRLRFSWSKSLILRRKSVGFLLNQLIFTKESFSQYSITINKGLSSCRQYIRFLRVIIYSFSSPSSEARFCRNWNLALFILTPVKMGNYGGARFVKLGSCDRVALQRGLAPRPIFRSHIPFCCWTCFS